MLKEIREKLWEIDDNVFYGAVDKKIKETAWDYIVFDRGTLKRNDNRTGYTETIGVHIVREEFVPEGLDEQVIEAMESIPGIRLSKSDCIYEYAEKPNTNVIVEMLSLEFTRSRRRK